MNVKSEITTAEEHFTRYHGNPGTSERIDFELRAKNFLIGEMIKDERKQAKLTQEQLAEKIGAKKSFISRIENGRTDIQLSTLYRILEIGLGKKLELSVH
ncbi:helix-turn-helix domain-containing protein [Dyadobacter sp.]|uniref:helix-turn-helix domain-containing protein n=1 Tax=Dyadobacter sp. TaxID=1914288 RepID=UPI003F725BF5